MSENKDTKFETPSVSYGSNDDKGAVVTMLCTTCGKSIDSQPVVNKKVKCKNCEASLVV